MGHQERQRRFAREDLIRVQANHEREMGKLPNMREIEKKAHERADAVDKKRDRKIHEQYKGE